jgi:DAK2 domain fusion protein YloV
MLIPNDGFLPQTSHTAAMTRRLPSNSSGNGDKVSILLMGALETLSASDLRRSISAFRDALRAHQEVINRLNVYPVPDGDTGTNMALTLETVVSDLDALSGGSTGDQASDSAGDQASDSASDHLSDADGPDLPTTCKAIAHGSLMGARGNSGVILSQLLRGICDELGALSGEAGPPDVARALARASELARQAVMRPVDGTILTVAAGAGEGATSAAVQGKSLVDVLDGARSGAAEALARTPELLPVLAQAGVVDAGGTGYLLLFDALLFVVDGRPIPEPPELPDNFDTAIAATHGADGESAEEIQAAVLAGLRYEVMYLLEAADETIPSFKEVWAGIGDSIVVVGGDGLWNCHIHTDDIGAAVEAALDAGRPRKIRVTDLLEQVEEERWVREGADKAEWGPSDVPPGPPPTTGAVAVATGVGIGRIFRSLGVHRLIAGGQSMNPSTAQILEAVQALGSDEVVILPNNKNIRPVAESVDALTSKTVRVIPTNTVAEGFAALLAYDPGAHIDANVRAMEASAERVVAGEVTQAVRDTESDVGPVKANDWLGLSRQGIEAVADTLSAASIALLDVLVTDEHELVTIIEGEGSGPAETRRITEWLRDNRPDVESEVHQGGQPLYPYLFSIE